MLIGGRVSVCVRRRTSSTAPVRRLDGVRVVHDQHGATQQGARCARLQRGRPSARVSGTPLLHCAEASRTIEQAQTVVGSINPTKLGDLSTIARPARCETTNYTANR